MLLTLLMIVCSWSVFTQQISTNTASNSTIIRRGVETSVVSASRLYEAILALRQEYGWTINYEAAPTYSSADRVEFDSHLVSRSSPKWRRVTRARTGPFSVEFSEAAARARDVAVVKKVVAAYNATDYAGKFDVRQGKEGRITVVGVQVKNESGVLENAPSILDTEISIAEADRTCYDALREITSALTARSGIKVIVGFVPNNIMLQAHCRTRGINVPARKVVEATLRGTGHSLQYDLGWDPDAPIYLLSVSYVVEPVEIEGHKGFAPVDSTRPQP